MPGASEKNGGYRLLKSIGRGGFAEVWRAEHKDRPGELVALKRPRRSEIARARLRREVDVQRNLDHPHVMPVLAGGDDFLVMPLAEGNLEELWTAGMLGDDAEMVAADILGSVAGALTAAHSQGYIHRDISPRNILALPDPEAPGGRRWVLADWGLVRRPAGQTRTRVTSPGQGLGTAGYAAPETWGDGHSAGPPADVYSLGRVLAWLLTGKDPAPNVQLLPEGPFRGLIAESTEPRPERRLPSAQSLLDRALELLEAPTASPSAQMAALVANARDHDDAETDALFDLARRHPDDASLHIDALATLPRSQVRAYAQAEPEDAAMIATTMLEHLKEMNWGRRDFNYANTPLGWVHTVLKTLVQNGPAGTAEDLATAFFRVEAHWNRFDQKAKTVAWLRDLTGSRAALVARALHRSGVSEFYADAVGDWGVKSPEISARLRP